MLSGGSGVQVSIDSAYHGSHGSMQTTACTMTAGSNVANCPTGTADFAVDQGIRFSGAGPAALESTPNAPIVTLVGAPGSTTYCYQVAEADYWGGISAASTSTCIGNGPPTTTPVNYLRIVTASRSCSYCVAIIYRQIGGSGQFVRIAETPKVGGTIDDSNLPITNDSSLPNVAPNSAINQNWVTQVTAINSTTLTLASRAAASVSSVQAIHDDTAAVQAAVDAVSVAGGGTVWLGAGTYNFNEVSYWNGASWVYTNPTSEPKANEMYGAVHLSSNVEIRGLNRKSTTVSSLLFAYVYHSIFATANPTPSLIPGPLCATGAETVLTKYAINNALRGATEIVLTAAINAANFKPGDLVFYGGGAVNGDVACGVSGNPSAELNRVVSVNLGTGTLHLRYLLTKDVPFGAPGTAAFIAKVNAYAKHDIGISNMTIQTLGGGYAVALGDVVHLRVSRVDMPEIDWSGKINIPESRDVVFDQMFLRITAADEYDQPRQVTFENSQIMLEGGSNQFAFSEGAANISLVHDTFASNDSYCGLLGRCDFGGPNAITLGAGGADYRIVNSQIKGSWTAPGVALQIFGPRDHDTPTLSGVLIRHNIVKANGLSTLDGFNLLAQATEQIVENNRIYLTPEAANSQCIYALTGLIANNYCNVTTLEAFKGIVHVDHTSAQTEPLALIGNMIEGPSGQPCIDFSGKRSDETTVLGNTCNGYCVQYPKLGTSPFVGVRGHCR